MIRIVNNIKIIIFNSDIDKINILQNVYIVIIVYRLINILRINMNFLY